MSDREAVGYALLYLPFVVLIVAVCIFIIRESGWRQFLKMFGLFLLFAVPIASGLYLIGPSK